MADSTHKSAAEIERELETERGALMRTLDEIQERLSFESLSNDMMGSLRSHGGEFGRSVSRSVRDNPVPLAITAIGLGWLAFSSSRTPSRNEEFRNIPQAPFDARAHGMETEAEREAAFARGRRTDPAAAGAPRPVYDASGRPLPPEPHQSDFNDPSHVESRWDKARHAVSGARNRASARMQEGRARMHEGRADAEARMAEARGELAGKSAKARGRVEGAAARAKGRFSGAMAGARRRGHGAYASAAELRERITHGTHDLSDQARARVLAARTRAYEAQLRAEHYYGRGRDRAVDFYEEQPLVAGALAIAAGAALGALLPRTRQEDSYFGAYRDDLFEEADRVYREERSKLEDVARSTYQEARDVARGTAKDIRSETEQTARDIGDKTKEAARDVADTARTEAENKNLGNRG